MTCQPLGLPRQGTPRRIFHTDKDITMLYGMLVEPWVMAPRTLCSTGVPTPDSCRSGRIARCTSGRTYPPSFGTKNGKLRTAISNFECMQKANSPVGTISDGAFF